MIENRRNSARGAVDGQLVALIGLVVLVVAMSGLAAWAYMNYNEQKTNVDSKIALAVAEAKKEQADSDEKKFAEREKEPNREFVGPSDYGRLTFKYPKTWSVYVESDVTTNGGDYTAYLNPVIVPPLEGSAGEQQYALRIMIEQTAYDEELESYKSRIETGELKSQPVSANGHEGTRLDGSFSDDIRGSAVLFKIRDKTLTVRTDANTFKPDFDTIIKTIDFKD